jgi:hypothetical protein
MSTGAGEVQRAEDEFTMAAARAEEAAGRETPEVARQALGAAQAAGVHRAEVAGQYPGAWRDLQARQDNQREAARAVGAEAWLSREAGAQPDPGPDLGAGA